MKNRFKKLVVLSLCLLGTFCMNLLKQNNKTNVYAQNQNIPVININKYHVTWVQEIEDGLQMNNIEWGDKPFTSNGITYTYFKYYQGVNSNYRVQIYYENFLVYDNGWLKQEYRVISYNTEYDFIDSTEDFTAEFLQEPFTIGYNIPIVLNNVWYRFTNSEPVNNTGNNRIWLNFYTTYFIPVKWQNSSGSFSEFNQSRNYWNNLWVTSNSISFCYSFTSEYGLETTDFKLLNNGEWSQNGGMGIPQDQVIRIADTITYDLYIFLMQNGYFGTYTELTYEPNDKEGFGNLIMSIANTPIEIISNLLNIKLMGVNLYSVFCGIITIFLAIFVIKRIT